ncbi:MAG: hypothetical protein FIA96_10100 [Betaproteobacteria bacterium]|nr:hypothetical protein [Betaproteobacteria bacterium]
MSYRGLSSHILPTSATMVGGCMTVLSIAKLLEERTRRGIVDETMAFDSLIFMFSAIFSYLSIRSSRQAERLERIADLAFMGGLMLMVAAAFVLAYELQ